MKFNCRRLLFWLGLLLVTSACSIPVLSAQKKARLAFGSCIDNPNSPIWKHLTKAQPDAVLLLGDNVYFSEADLADRNRIKQKYGSLLTYQDFVTLRESIPVYATWDDHDFGPNNSDSTFRGKDLTRAEFNLAWAGNPPPPPGLESSIAFEFSIGNLLVLVPDSRTYRDNSESSLTLFGEHQLTWLESRIANTNAKWVIIASSNQWFSLLGEKAEGKESLRFFPNEEKRLMRILAKSKIPITIVSGDRHLGEVFLKTIGEKQVYEFTSSPITAPVATDSYAEQEPLRQIEPVRQSNIGIFELELSPKFNLRVKYMGENGEVLRSFSVPGISQ